ncbi:MAG: lytic transglycosylase domain-containing protein [Bacteroidales bacterium]
MRKIYLLSIVLLFAAAVFMMFTFSSSESVASDDGEFDLNDQQFSATSPPIPVKVDFAGEDAPLNLYSVREYLDRELLVNTYFHSSTIQLLKCSNRWFPVIEPILKENNIPDDFKYLALIESGFLNVKSPRGAAGFWQFMEKTAKEYKLEVNDYVDERYNLELATTKACEYLADSFEEYQNWTLVAAAYNAGNRRISESIEQQKTNDYYDLYLNEETSRYVFRILAIKTIFNDPLLYGFDIKKTDLYPVLNTKEITVDTAISNLVDFALAQGISYRNLKELNPWLRTNYLTNKSGKLYTIKLPK